VSLQQQHPTLPLARREGTNTLATCSPPTGVPERSPSYSTASRRSERASGSQAGGRAPIPTAAVALGGASAVGGIAAGTLWLTSLPLRTLRRLEEGGWCAVWCGAARCGEVRCAGVRCGAEQQHRGVQRAAGGEDGGARLPCTHFVHNLVLVASASKLAESRFLLAAML